MFAEFGIKYGKRELFFVEINGYFDIVPRFLFRRSYESIHFYSFCCIVFGVF